MPFKSDKLGEWGVGLLDVNLITRRMLRIRNFRADKKLDKQFLWTFLDYFICCFLRPSECHHHFSVATLVGVLKRATQKRKFIRDERTMDRLEAKDRETSRSDSQASEAPSKIANTQQSVTGELKIAGLFIEMMSSHCKKQTEWNLVCFNS